MSVGADLEIAVRELVNEINAAARSRATRGTNILRNAALEVLGHDGSGRVYKKWSRCLRTWTTASSTVGQFA